MIEIRLEQHEAETLRTILESYRGDLRMEIAGTDLKNFRDGLKETEMFINDLLTRLDGGRSPNAAPEIRRSA
jgi:hypothetical protein